MIDNVTSLHVVARFADGRMLKGTTRDFSPNKPDFHVYPDGELHAKAVKVPVAQLKAVFFVKTLEGDKHHVEANDATDNQGQGRLIRVSFKDGEVLVGSTVGYAPERPGFFFVPCDRESNNLRVFVVRSAVAKVEFLPSAQAADRSRSA